MTPLSGSANHQIAPWAYWHARSMVLGWGVLLPLGVLLARFFKVRSGQSWPAQLDDKLWWHGHQALQWSGVAAISVGAWLAWGHATGASAAARWHGWLGWALCAAGWAQIAGALLRGSKGGPTDTQMRGDHYDMSPRRKAFEWTHKVLGWSALLVAAGVLVLGLVVADAPRWMPLVLALWWLALGAAFVQLQRAGRCVDTYQAIWGPDTSHPGNSLTPIGWGVHRPLG